jgi:hypothetical protein
MIGECARNPAGDVSATDDRQVSGRIGRIVACVGAFLEFRDSAVSDQQVGQMVWGEAVTTIGAGREQGDRLIDLLASGQRFGEPAARQPVAGVGPVSELRKMVVVTVVIDQPTHGELVTAPCGGAYLIEVGCPE